MVNKIIMPRECFRQELHDEHLWHDIYTCTGRGTDINGKTRATPEQVKSTFYRFEHSINGVTGDRRYHYWAGAPLPIRSCELDGPHEEHAWDWTSENEEIGERSYCPGIALPIIVPRRSGKTTKINELKKTMTQEEREVAEIESGWRKWCHRHDEHDEHEYSLNGVTTFCPGIYPVAEPKPITGNAELAHRPEYGDPLQNMREQAAMINAYLSGREVVATDVPVIFILAKLHRMGKMPDYKDNYDDVKGYLRLSEGLIGDDMIDAATTKEYSEIKRRGNQADGRAMDAFLWTPDQKITVIQPEGSGNPYANVKTTCDKCGHAEHDGGPCLNMQSDNDCDCRA